MEATNRKPRTTRPAPTPSAAPSEAAGADADVIVVGAGPTGLLLAGDLAESGLRVTLLERRPETTSNLTRALIVHARTLEQLDSRGLADALVSRGHPIRRLTLLGAAAIDPARLTTRFPFVLAAPQFEVERLLDRRARAAGVTFRYESEVLGLEQDAGGVTVEISDASGVTAARAAYVVGTDGVRSTVREAVGLPFPGKTVARLVLADVRLTEEPEAPFLLNAANDALALIGSFGDGWYRVGGWNPHQPSEDTPPDLDEVREFTRRALGSDYGMHDARWISRFHSDERQVPAYRVGRVLLAGDAAHVHSPAGGMGMNTGLQDAANLSWKLAAVLQNRSPASLLDSYHTERHPVGQQVLRTSGTLIRVGLLPGLPGRVVRAVGSRLVSHLRPLSLKALRNLSGLGVRYPAEHGAHPLTGRRAPDLRLAGGSRLHELLRQGKFVLIAPAGETADQPAGATGPLVRASWASNRRTALLVRPDGYIAWATDSTAPAERAAALRTALTRWTGSDGGTGTGTGTGTAISPAGTASGGAGTAA